MNNELDRFLNIPRASERQKKSKPAEVWYGLCGYWTDDWSKLRTVGSGIPCCPECGAVGFQQSADEWWRQVDAYEAAGHSGYRAKVEADKGKCPRATAHNEV